MRRSTILSLGVALILATGAAIGMQQWLADQQAAMQARVEQGIVTGLVVTARHDLAAGERLQVADLQLTEWHGGDLPAGAFTDISAVAGQTDADSRFAVAAIYANEPVLDARLSRPGQKNKLSAAIADGMRAVSIRVNDVQGVAGFVLPGDRVDVLLTHSAPDGRTTKTYVDLLLQSVKVVAVDQMADAGNEQPSVVRTVTFEVTPEQSKKLTLAATVGTLSLALRNLGSQDVLADQPLSTDGLGLSTPAPAPDPAGPPPAPQAAAPLPQDSIGVMRNGEWSRYPVPSDDGREN